MENLIERVLSHPTSGEYQQEHGRVASAFKQVWKRGVKLAQRISSDLPNLTLHDEDHLRAVLDRIDQLAGPNYDLNPLEAFVLGAAVVLHDAGLAVAAYAGGMSEIIQTLQYRDAIAALKNFTNEEGRLGKQSTQNATAEEHAHNTALLQTLRRLHAQQAEALATRSIKGEFLIDDTDLRLNLGETIGRIAASHNSSLAQVETDLRDIQGAPSWHAFGLGNSASQAGMPTSLR